MNNRDKILELAEITASNRAGIGVFGEMNFSLFAGETAIVVGASGTGKTTLAELILGELRPEFGSVSVFGRIVGRKNERNLKDIRQKIGGVGGIFDLIPNRSVAENVIYPLIIKGESVSGNRLRQILMQFNLHGRRKDKAFRLTRGEKILAMLARSVIADQPLLIIDEPLERLSPELSDRIVEILKRLSAAGHALLILTNGKTPIEIPSAQINHIRDGKIL